MDVEIISVPIDYAAGTRGSSLGPKTLLDAGLAACVGRQGHKVEVVECEVARHDENEIENPKARFLSSVVATNRNLSEIVCKAVGRGYFPLVIGGDHSVLLGSLAGVASSIKGSGKEIGVVYVDAHGDFNTLDTTPTGNLHGMPLAASCGLGLRELTELGGVMNKVEAANVCVIGARDLDKLEKELMREAGVKIYDAVAIERCGISAVVEECIDYLKDRCDWIHLSFDVDSVDALYAPGTGIRLPGGLTFREAVTLMEMLSESGLVKSADYVEFNPTMDIDGATKELSLVLLSHLLGERYA